MCKDFGEKGFSDFRFALSNHRRIAKPFDGTSGVLELFSGVGGLSAAFRRKGVRVFPGFEILDRPCMDLTRPPVQALILDLIASGAVWYVPMGTPCTVWSSARHNITNEKRARYKERVGVSLALFTAK
eukprot:114187-Karenia_brevis.AAC.1